MTAEEADRHKQTHSHAAAAEEPKEHGATVADLEPLVAEETDDAPEISADLKRLKDQLLRTAADFDNFRKRSRREVADAAERGKEMMLKELLPVFDNLERATVHSGNATNLEAFVEGIEMVMKQFAESLSRAGIERVPSVGAPFDPAVHEAIQHLPTNDHPPGTVTAEVQGGYRLGDRLIRAALVVVAKAPEE